MPLTNYLDQALNQLVFGDTAYSVPGTLYFALSTSTPAQDGTGVTEPVGNNYARVGVTNNTSNFHASPSQPATGQKQSNVNTVTFNQASGSWGTVTYVCVFDANSSGNMLAFAQLGTSQTISNGDTLSFATDALTWTLN